MLLFLGLSLSERGFAQQFSLKELPISVAYFGENGIHPGLKFSTSYAFWSKTKYRQYHSLKKQGKWGEKGKRRELLADFNLGFYSHPNNHTGIFGNVGASYLRTKLRKNRQFGISLEVGFLGRINKFNTYQLSPGGNIEEIRFAGNTALML